MQPSMQNGMRQQPRSHPIRLRPRHQSQDLVLAQPSLFTLGCNSIDIWNLRLELGRKLRQGLRTRLGRCQIGPCLWCSLRPSLKYLLNYTPRRDQLATVGTRYVDGALSENVREVGRGHGRRRRRLLLVCASGRPERPFCRISAESFCRNSEASITSNTMPSKFVIKAGNYTLIG